MGIPDKLKKQLEKMYVKDTKNNSKIPHSTQGKPNLEQEEQHNAGQGNEGKATTSQSNEEQYTPEDNSPARTYEEYLKVIRAEDVTPNQNTEHQSSEDVKTPSQQIQEQVNETNHKSLEDHSNAKQVPSSDGTHSSEAGIQQSKIQERKIQTNKPHENDVTVATDISIRDEEVQSNSGYLQIEDISGKDNIVKPRPIQIDSIPEDAISYDNYINLDKVQIREEQINSKHSIEEKTREDKPIAEREEQIQGQLNSENPTKKKYKSPEEKEMEDVTDLENMDEEADEEDMQEEETKNNNRIVPIGTPVPVAPVSIEPEVPSVQQQTQAQQFVEQEQKELEQDEAGGYGQFQQDEFLSEDEARAKIATMLIDRENRETMSELNDYEIFQLSIVNAVAKDFDIDIVKQWANELLDFKVSRARAGRLEVKEVASPSVKREQDKKSVMEMIMGGRKF